MNQPELHQPFKTTSRYDEYAGVVRLPSGLKPLITAVFRARAMHTQAWAPTFLEYDLGAIAHLAGLRMEVPAAVLPGEYRGLPAYGLK